MLVSAVVHVGWNALLKSSRDPRAFALLKGTVILLFAVAAAPWIPIERIPADVWPMILASAVIHTAYIISLSAAYESGDISFVYPIVRSSPALVPIAAWFLIGERLSLQGIAGIGIVVAGILALQKRPSTGGLLRPDLVWALVCLLTVVGYTLVDKTGMVRLSAAESIPAIWRGPTYFALEHALSYVLFWAWTFARGLPPVRETVRREGVRIVVAAFGLTLSYSLILHVLQTEEASYVVTLRQSSVVMAVLAGVFWFREGQAAYRIAVAVAMIAGFYLVATA